MPYVHPFHALHFAHPRDQSALVAPPYDVLDAAGKQRLLAKNPHNIVAIDLPHTPAKELGPSAAYSSAAELLRDLCSQHIITRTTAPVMFAYRQSWSQSDPANPARSLRRSRSGMACTLDTVPFGPRPGGGILPHEETFSGPKQDRMALMQATRTQLSPIFGLHADEHAAARAVLESVMTAAPDRTATTDDGTFHEVWHVHGEKIIRDYQTALAGEDIFVADGHHRYTTALNYLRALETEGPVPADHPARRTMFVLIGMSDPGLIIWPTHRVLGGMRAYSFEQVLSALRPHCEFTLVAGGPRELEVALARSTSRVAFGLHDFGSQRSAFCIPSAADPLAASFPHKSPAWRSLTVAFVQHILVEQICQPVLNNHQPITWAFPHTIPEVIAIGAGQETGAGGGAAFATGAQLAVIVQPTPLTAVRDVSRAGELMPQKSTFFYPKLATGLFMHELHQSPAA